MKKKIVNLLMGLTLSMGLLMNQGCVALVVGAAVGAGGFAYIKGNLEQNLDYQVKDIYNASLKALGKMKIDVYQKTLEPHAATIYGYTSGQKKTKIKVTVLALTEKASNLKVRYGIVGDESKSIDIIEAIKKEL